MLDIEYKKKIYNCYAGVLEEVKVKVEVKRLTSTSTLTSKKIRHKRTVSATPEFVFKKIVAGMGGEDWYDQFKPRIIQL